MRSLVSIRLDDELLKKMRAKAQALQLSQTDYIRQAIEQMNDKIEQKEREKRLKQASLQVRAESMKVNMEFDDIGRDPEN